MTPPLFYPISSGSGFIPEEGDTPAYSDSSIMVVGAALHGGDLVNVYSVDGAARVRPAIGSTAGQEAHGYVLVNAEPGENITVYFEGTNDQVTALTPGPQYLGTLSGKCSSSAPSVPGGVAQRVGVAVSATRLNFEAGAVTVLA